MLKDAANPNNSLIIQIRNVSKVFNPGDPETRLEALCDINLDIGQNEFISLIGPSGCGKSTLLRLISDLSPLTEGEILVNGHPPSVSRNSREIAFVFQDATLFAWRTVLENVALPLQVMGVSKAERERYARERLALVGLKGFESAYPRSLSGGMKQRVSIARALTYDPKILLMDEPFGALDAITRERMNDELLQIWEAAKNTILFVTHSIYEAIYLSDRVLIMSARPGRIVQDVKVDFPRPRTSELRGDPEFIRLSNSFKEYLQH